MKQNIGARYGYSSLTKDDIEYIMKIWDAYIKEEIGLMISISKYLTEELGVKMTVLQVKQELLTIKPKHRFNPILMEVFFSGKHKKDK